MEKLYKEPYDNPNLVKIYEERYIHQPDQAEDVSFEIKVTEKVVDHYKYKSWCDVACGTGYHLRKTSGNLKRLGVDKSKLMIDQHKKDTEYDIEYSVANILSWRTKKKFDLVTNFWFGYSHQPSLKKVINFFEKMIDLTARHGTIVLSVHNHWKLFNEKPRLSMDVESQFTFDAIHWSYTEPSTNDKYRCISPHKDLILDTFVPYFKEYNISEYPRVSAKELFVFRNRNATRRI